MISSIKLPSKLQSRVTLKAQDLKGGKLDQLPAAFQILDEVAAHHPGCMTSRLAQVAQKVGRGGDSTVAEMGGVEILDQLASFGDAMGPALNMLVGPVSTVVRVTLESMDQIKGDDNFVTTLAKTGLKAMDSEKESSNPMASGLVAEPFVLGIAEHDSVNETAAEVCDFLQDELEAILAQPAREAYRSVLFDLSENPNSSKSGLLARSGLALLHSIPGEESSMVSMASTFVEELGQGENPFSASLAGEAADLVESYGKEEETKPQALTLTEAVLQALGASPETNTVQGAAALGESWTKTLSNLDLPAEDRMEMANSYFESLAEEAGTPILELSSYWLERLPEEAVETRFAIMETVLSDTAANPNRPATGIVDLAQKIANTQPEVRDAALGAMLGMMSEELDLDEFAELEGEDYSPQALHNKEQALDTLAAQIAKMVDTPQ